MAGSEGEEQLASNCDERKNYWRHPATYIALGITFSLILLIAVNVLGWDRGHTLDRLAGTAFARGLITYIFAVGTIGVFVTITLSALLAKGSADQRIARAKDILSLLLGLFGTIVGYYFGSQPEAAAFTPLEFAIVRAPTSAIEGEAVPISVEVRGGHKPYEYWLVSDGNTARRTIDGVASDTLTCPVGIDTLAVLLVAKDRAGSLVAHDLRILTRSPGGRKQ